MITACEAITVAAVASSTIGSRAQSGASRKNGLLMVRLVAQDQRALAEVASTQAGNTRPSQARVIARRPKWPMSAYSASAPVTASTIAASAKNAMSKWPTRKPSA